MGFSYHFTLSAAASVTAEELLQFLKSVETDARKLGFHPTVVLDAPFDTPERQEFAKRVVRGLHIEDERLKGVELAAEERVWNFSSTFGECLLAPMRAVLLVVTNERGSETIFGFAKFPEKVRDTDGQIVLKRSEGSRWLFRDFVDSPDSRYRKIVKRFADAGYVKWERDEFAILADSPDQTAGPR